MRCKYRFAVYGQLKVDTWCPIPVGDVTYQCEPNAIRIVKVISAEFSVADPALWPKGTPSQTPGVKIDFQGLGRRLPEITKNLRAVEGLLSLYGVERIDLDYPEESWLPDNEAEKAQLEIFSFKRSRGKISDEEVSPLSFDLVARSFIAAPSVGEFEVALSFFRRGQIDVREHLYIEAIYDYYFVLETVYGEGKSKNARIQETFKQNPKLLEIIRHVLSDPLHLAPVLQDHSMNEAFTAAYARQSPETIIDHIVELRGFLHHHSIRRPGIWHPEDDKRFKIGAFVLERVAFETVFEIARPHVFSDAAAAAYAAVVRQAEVNGTVSLVQQSETGPMDESG